MIICSVSTIIPNDTVTDQQLASVARVFPPALVLRFALGCLQLEYRHIERYITVGIAPFDRIFKVLIEWRSSKEWTVGEMQSLFLEGVKEDKLNVAVLDAFTDDIGSLDGMILIMNTLLITNCSESVYFIK